MLNLCIEVFLQKTNVLASWLKDSGDTTAVMGGTLAHELGHNFGLLHNPDNSSAPCGCQTASCVMDAVSTYGVPAEVFTSCQQTSITNFLQTGKISLPRIRFHRPNFS